MKYNYAWITEWDKEKKLKIIANWILYLFDLIAMIRFYPVAVIGCFVSLGILYWGIFIEDAVGVWLVLTVFNASWVAIVSLSYSTRRHIC